MVINRSFSIALLELIHLNVLSLPLAEFLE